MDSTRLLEAIIDNAIDGIITITHRGIVQSINPAALQLFGYETSEVVGNNVSMLMPEPDHSNHDTYLENYLRTGQKKSLGSAGRCGADARTEVHFPSGLR